jgi:hypothetical protein
MNGQWDTTLNSDGVVRASNELVSSLANLPVCE